MIRIRMTLACLAIVLGSSLPALAEEPTIVIYGATPGGIAAAIGAAKEDQTVLLLEPTQQIGGLVTSGLSHTDFHSFESLTGTYFQFASRVREYYATKYGADSQQVRDCFRGTFAEPKVNLAVFEAMLAELPKIEVRRQVTLVSVACKETASKNLEAPLRHIDSATFQQADGSTFTTHAAFYIDGTYEGDLMAAAGVAFRVGREGKVEYLESLAPDQPDNQLQAYNFRFIMTKDPANRVAPVAPDGYRREDFVDVLPILKSGQIKKVFDYPSGCIFKAQTPPLPNGKYDINDVSRGVIRLSLPGKNLAWPEGSAEQRQTIFNEHRRDQVGLLYFLQNDKEVPAKFQEEARQWGWCQDEFAQTEHLPPQLYVREARRMVGRHVFTQHDSAYAEEDARAVLFRDAIAMGDYGNNCHGTYHEGPRFGGKHTGEFYNPVAAYQIPYGVLVSKDVGNLLVPVAASSTHVGFCALRLEPIWMSLGQAAGHAAGLAAKNKQAVQQVDVAQLQRQLHQDGSATIYFSDIPPDHPDFALAQWWGTAGGFHGLHPRPANGNPRGKGIHGQYCGPFPNHAAELDKPLTAELRERWLQLAQELKISPADFPAADGKTTRREILQAAWKARGN